MRQSPIGASRAGSDPGVRKGWRRGFAKPRRQPRFGAVHERATGGDLLV
ncbi:MAG: hypothetical protein AVDCRST_MAG25-3139 [uncultured Rubrobacteraceae bacterium]|uniref:Uncharacterized protein n=1 Tax=uncultured Rubrobacteraceae bacterium TaxID=349277 RepID=A0A6J4S1W5_9ACTN|nr:MAG: hypothetical protein AVDCRST_MAG25-3139 [uncultured Rubrobacteraceae bacterium]